MPAPEGNSFWKQRSSHGRKPIFETPDALWEACCEYFDWVEANPLLEAENFAYQGTVTAAALPKMRAMSIGALCIFLDINRSTWPEYMAREGFTEVCTRVEEIIRSQKFEGASAGLLNASIIARDLGLSEKVDTTSSVHVTIEGKDAALL